MKSLLQYLNGYKKEAILAPLLKLLEASFDLIVPLVMAEIIDVGIANADKPYIFGMCGVLLALAVVGLVISITAQWFAAKAATGFSHQLRHALFARIQDLSYSQIDRIGTDTLITRMTSDVNQVQNGINLTLRLLLRSPFIVVGAMILAFTVDVQAAVVFAVVIPVLAVVVFGIMLGTMPMYRRVQGQLDHLMTATRENLTGARVIRAFGREEHEIHSFRDNNDRLTQLQQSVGRISGLMNPLTYVIVNIATASLIYVGAVRVNIGSLTQGQVVALLNYMSQILVELIKLANLIIQISKAAACAGRIADILALEPDMTDGVLTAEAGRKTAADRASSPIPPQTFHAEGEIPTGDVSEPDDGRPPQTFHAKDEIPTGDVSEPDDGRQRQSFLAKGEIPTGAGKTQPEAAADAAEFPSSFPGFETVPPVVEFRHVSLTYAGAAGEALTDISFSVRPGETVGIIGGTGSGKSSLVGLIPRFYDATKGEVFLFGRKVQDYQQESLLSRIGIVPQRAELFKGTIAENLSWGKNDPTEEEMQEALAASQAKEFVDQKPGGTDYKLEQNGRNLSGGQRQRLTIARALIRKPDILILDDAASALDFATDAKLRAAIRNLTPQPATFIVSQRAASVQYADQILVLDEGHLAGLGTHEELLRSNAVYQEIYYSQFPKEDAG